MLTRARRLLFEELVDRDDQAVLTQLDARYRPILANFCRRLGLDDVSAEDLARSTLQQFVDEHCVENGGGGIRSRLFSLIKSRVRNADRDHAPGPSHRRSIPRELPGDEQMSALLRAEWRRALLKQAILEYQHETTTDRQTLQAFEMLARGHPSVAEVAEQLGMSVNSVYVAKHRALERLRVILSRLEQEF